MVKIISIITWISLCCAARLSRHERTLFRFCRISSYWHRCAALQGRFPLLLILYFQVGLHNCKVEGLKNYQGSSSGHFLSPEPLELRYTFHVPYGFSSHLASAPRFGCWPWEHSHFVWSPGRLLDYFLAYICLGPWSHGLSWIVKAY